MTRAYYIAFERYVGVTVTKSWRITETEHDLDSTRGLTDYIDELEAEVAGSQIFLINWMPLAVSKPRRSSFGAFAQ